jgi:hypothetical protein
MYRVPSINNYHETRGKLRNSQLDLDELRESGELNQLLYWKYYFEVYPPKDFDIEEKLKPIRERLFYNHDWIEDNWEHSIPGILYLLICIPVAVYKKDLSQICKLVMYKSSYGAKFENDLGLFILEHYFYRVEDALTSESMINTEKSDFYLRYGFPLDESEWIDINWHHIQKYQDRWLKFKSRILDNIEVFELWMVLILSKYDPINITGNIKLHDFLGEIIKKLTPDIHHYKKLVDSSQSHQANITKEYPWSDMENMKWENIILEFTSDESLSVNLSGNRKTTSHNFTQLGFDKKRHPHKKILIWELLNQFATNGGSIVPVHRTRMEKSVSDLRKHLQYLFGIGSSPIQWKRNEGCYKTKFIIRPNKNRNSEISDPPADF